MSVLPNLIYRFNMIPIKIPASYFVDTDKPFLKFIWIGKRFRIANTILKEKDKVEGVTLHIHGISKRSVVTRIWATERE